MLAEASSLLSIGESMRVIQRDHAESVIGHVCMARAFIAWNRSARAFEEQSDGKIVTLIGKTTDKDAKFKAMQDNVSDGVTNHYWPDEVLGKLRGAWDEVIAEEVKTNLAYRGARGQRCES